jgi:hypothetical protein
MPCERGSHGIADAQGKESRRVTSPSLSNSPWMDTRSAPEWVGGTHPAAQLADFGIRLGSSVTA